MNEGVKILIERMKTNPEEFTDGSKWAGVIHGYKSYLSKEDEKALDDAYNGLMQAKFTEKVMKELLAPEEDDSLGKPWFSNTANVTLSGGVAPVRSSVTLNNTNTVGTWKTSRLEHTLARLEELKQEYEPKKQHQTIFGKLKNYLYNE